MPKGIPNKLLLNEGERKRLAALLQVVRWRSNPHLWAKDRLGIDLRTLDWQLFDQLKYNWHKWDGTKNPIAEVGRLLGSGRNVAVESATGTGKTYFAAILVLWFLDCWPKTETSSGGLVITLAPKEDQLRLNLWKEIGRLWPRFQKIRPLARLMSLRIRMDPDSDEKDSWGAIGYPVGVGAEEMSATRMQGFHAKDMFIIIEETPGVPMPVVEAAMNTCVAPHNLILALGNPDSEFDTLHQLVQMPQFAAITISALDHPNVVLNNPELIPGAVSKPSIESRLLRFKGDEEHPLYLSRVRGVCPTMSDQSLFRPEAIRAARQALRLPIRREPLPNGEIRYYHEVQTTYRHRYLMFADVAGDLEDGDAHGAILLDRITQGIVAVIHMRGPRETYVKALLRVADQYKVDTGDDPKKPKWAYPVMAWETNGVGALHLVPSFRAYPNLYYRRSTDMDNPTPRSTLGWVTTEKSRATMMAELGEWGLEVIAKPFMLCDEEVIKECTTLVWVSRNKNTGAGRFEAKSGAHDDLAMALSGALTIHKLLPVPVMLPRKDAKLDREREHAIDRWKRDRLNRSGGKPVANYLGSSAVDPRLLPTTP